jgi:hypothetical protein
VGRREDIDNATWGDPDFAALSPEAKLLYLWSFTNPLCNFAGLYKVTTARMASETGLTPRRTETALAELVRDRFVQFEHPLLWIRSRVKHLPHRSPNIAKAISRDIELVDADHPLRHLFLEKYERTTWDALRDRLAPLVEESGSSKPNPGTVAEPLANGSGTVLVRGGEGSSKEEQPTAQGEVDAEPELPDELRPFLEPVLVTLRRVATTKPGAALPTLAAVAGVLRRYPTKDFIPTAEDYAHWSIHGRGASRSVKDVVAQYRNWLAKEPDVARRTPSSNGKLTDPTEDRLRRATA